MSSVSMRFPDGVSIVAGHKIALPADLSLNIPGIGEIKNVSIITGSGLYIRETGSLNMKGGQINFSGGTISGPINVENLTLQLTQSGLKITGRGCKTVFLFPVCQNVDSTIPYSGSFTREAAQNLIESVLQRTGRRLKVGSNPMYTYEQMRKLFMQFRSV